MDRRTREVTKFYDKYAYIYDEVRYASDKQKFTSTLELQKVSKLAGDTNNKLLLDAGCGTGRFMDFFNKEGANTIGLDTSHHMLKILKTRMAETRVVNGDILHLPFKEATFDLIVCSQLLTHLHQYKKPLIEFKRVLKDDGVIIIDIRNILHPVSILWLLREKVIRKRIFTKVELNKDPAYSPHHTCIWKIKKICRQIGLEVKEFTGCGKSAKYVSQTVVIKIVKSGQGSKNSHS